MRTTAIVLVCAAGLFATPTYAGMPALLVDESSAGAAAVGPGVSIVGLVGQNTAANDFSITAPGAMIRSAAFYSLEGSTNPWDGAITYTILGDSTGSTPSDQVFATGTVETYIAETVTTDAATNLIRRIAFDLQTPVGLAPGDYWLAITATQAEGAGSLGWRLVQPTGLSVSSPGTDLSGWTLQQGEAAFQLLGEPIPAPGALVLLSAFGLVTRRRR